MIHAEFIGTKIDEETGLPRSIFSDLRHPEVPPTIQIIPNPDRAIIPTDSKVLMLAAPKTAELLMLTTSRKEHVMQPAPKVIHLGEALIPMPQVPSADTIIPLPAPRTEIVKQKPETFIGEIAYIGGEKPAGIIKTMDQSSVETQAPKIQEVQIHDVPTTDEIKDEISQDRKGKSRWASFKQGAALKVASVLMAVGAVFGVAKASGVADKLADYASRLSLPSVEAGEREKVPLILQKVPESVAGYGVIYRRTDGEKIWWEDTNGNRLDLTQDKINQLNAQEFQALQDKANAAKTPTATPTTPSFGLTPTAGPESQPSTIGSTPAVTSENTPNPRTTVENKIEPFDNGILPPDIYPKAEYITWTNPSGSTYEAIGLKLEKGKELKLPENLQVAAIKRPNGGYRITAVRQNGSEISIYGDIIPNTSIDNLGKILPAGSVIGISGNSGITVLNDDYTTFITFSDKTDLQRFFPDQTKDSPKTIINKQAQSNTQTTPSTPSATIFFDVTPPGQK